MEYKLNEVVQHKSTNVLGRVQEPNPDYPGRIAVKTICGSRIIYFQPHEIGRLSDRKD